MSKNIIISLGTEFIENEDEDVEKYDSNAMKNHYLLVQIADVLMQLYLAWNPLIKGKRKIKTYPQKNESRIKLHYGCG